MVEDLAEFKKRARSGLKPFLLALPAFSYIRGVGIEVDDLSDQLILRLINGHKILFEAANTNIEIEETSWHREFVLSIPNKVIWIRFNSKGLQCAITW